MNYIFSSILVTSFFSFSGIVMAKEHTLTVATFNVSMESENYLAKGVAGSPQVLSTLLAEGDHPQIKNIAAIVQQTQPDILLLNEFDYIEDPKVGVQLFIRNYLNKAQSADGKIIDYPYFYYSTVNTGQPSGFDLDNDGQLTNKGADAWGFGQYPGQYGMMLLSKYPINSSKVRTFQHFKWKDMPGALQTTKADGSPWYSPEAWQLMPLSSKAHWDVPVLVNKKPVHLLISHPTPPVFDGDEDRNGKRNHDEVRFWTDYLTPTKSAYIYDDRGQKGGLGEDKTFVILGDLNSSPVEGNAYKEGIGSLLMHPRVNSSFTPQSEGGKAHSLDSPYAATHTAGWRMRADYVLPSKQGFEVLSSGVFWPAKGQPFYELVADRTASSDHRLVWVKLKLTAH
ncbi:endonuclease [Rheinheimera mesophila]|nr:endonuclease [Rheinheimera mesophila]